ncbi:MAG TPA: hypothetical protein VK902_18950 [Rubrobacter sp.]|nr:hypothetical protein [Rubrobacter sp.]
MSGDRFRQMEDEEATQISGWHYEPPYDFYDATSDPDDLKELLHPKRKKDAYFSVFDEGGILVGFRRNTVYKHNTNGGEYLFLSMSREA